MTVTKEALRNLDATIEAHEVRNSSTHKLQPLPFCAELGHTTHAVGVRGWRHTALYCAMVAQETVGWCEIAGHGSSFARANAVAYWDNVKDKRALLCC